MPKYCHKIKLQFFFLFWSKLSYLDQSSFPLKVLVSSRWIMGDFIYYEHLE